MPLTRSASAAVISIDGRNADDTAWTDLRVTRGIERFPSDFEFSASAGNYLPGMTVTIYHGGDLLLTGVIDRVIEQATPESHNIHITGRSRCRELVDNSAEIVEWKGFKLKTDITSMARELCKPYGITVTDNTKDNPVFETFTASLGETPYEIIERVARSVGVLVHDDPEGNLVLSRSLTAEEVSSANPRVAMLGGIDANIQAMTRMLSGDNRYGKYTVVAQPVDSFSDRRASGQAASGATAGGFIKGDTFDIGSNPVRHLYIVGEQWIGAQSLAQKRADWEANRRWGRSHVLTMLLGSWQSRLSLRQVPSNTPGTTTMQNADAPPKLWHPNMPIAVIAPELGLYETSSTTGADLVIAQVTYSQTAKGTSCEIVAMRREAFIPEPIGIQRQDADRVLEADRARREEQGVQGPNQ